MKKYLITDPKYYGSDIETFAKNLENILFHVTPDMVCYRDKQNLNYSEFAKKFIQISRDFKIKTVLLHSDYQLADTLKADGVHLQSNDFDSLEKAKKLNLKTVLSCHNFDEVQKASSMNCDFVTYSPIFETPEKGKPKGLTDLQNLINKFKNKIRIIALGGIVSKEEIEKLKRIDSLFGFASIRYFTKFNLRK